MHNSNPKVSIATGAIGPILILISTLAFHYFPDENGGLGFVLLLLVFPSILIGNVVLMILLKIFLKEKYNLSQAIITFLVLLLPFILLSLFSNNQNSVG